jgi:hypothetical protein
VGWERITVGAVLDDRMLPREGNCYLMPVLDEPGIEFPCSRFEPCNREVHGLILLRIEKMNFADLESSRWRQITLRIL